MYHKHKEQILLTYFTYNQPIFCEIFTRQIVLESVLPYARRKFKKEGVIKKCKIKPNQAKVCKFGRERRNKGAVWP